MNHKQHKHRHHSRIYQEKQQPPRLRHWIIPHAQNQYRPHVVRRYGLLAVLALVIGLQLIQLTGPYRAVLGNNTSVTPENILANSNQARTDQHETPLRANAKLTQAAKLKASDMLRQQYWSHVSPKGAQPWHWFDESGYVYSVSGENLAKNFATSSGVVQAWLASPSHRENLLNTRFTETGVAVATGTLDGKPATIVVALYGAPATAVAAGAINSDDSGMSAVALTQQPAGGVSLLERGKIALETLSPLTAIGVALLLLVALVALMAQTMRHKLPRHHRAKWYRRHHGVIKSLGLGCLAVILVAIYAGGQL